MAVNRVATSKKVISGKTINTLLSGKGAEERNNGAALSATETTAAANKHWFSGLVKLT